MKANNSKWFLLFVLSLIWGSSFVLIKKGLVGLNPFQLGSLRIVLAAIFLLLLGFKTLFSVSVKQWKYLAATALFGTFIPAYLFSIAVTEIDSSVSAVLNSLTPLNTLIVGFLAFGLNFKKTQLIGVTVGLIGCALLILNGAENHPNQNYYYAFLVIVASICYAINVNLIKKYLSDLSPLTISAGNFAVMLVPALVILFSNGFFEVVQDVKVQQSIVFIVVLGVVGTGIANILFFRLIQMSSPVFATSVTYLIPIVAFFWGLLDGERLTLIQFLGAFIVLTGVYLSSSNLVLRKRVVG